MPSFVSAAVVPAKLALPGRETPSLEQRVKSMDSYSVNKPIWEPGQDRVDRANLNRFMRFVRERTNNDDIRRFAPLHDFSIRQPERFWQLLWEFCGIRANGNFEPAMVDGDQLPGALMVFPEYD